MKKTIHYNELMKRNAHLNQLRRQGFIIIEKKHNRVIAFVLIGLGVVTLPLPTGSILLIAFGLGMLGLSIDKIREKVRKFIFMIKYKRSLK